MQTSILGIGYAYDSHLSYLDHLRIADSARRAGAAAGEAADRGARRVEAGIAAAATQVEGRIAAAATQITDAMNEVSSEIRAAREVMEWGFSATINELAGIKERFRRCSCAPAGRRKPGPMSNSKSREKTFGKGIMKTA